MINVPILFKIRMGHPTSASQSSIHIIFHMLSFSMHIGILFLKHFLSTKVDGNKVEFIHFSLIVSSFEYFVIVKERKVRTKWVLYILCGLIWAV